MRGDEGRLREGAMSHKGKVNESAWRGRSTRNLARRSGLFGESGTYTNHI